MAFFSFDPWNTTPTEDLYNGFWFHGKYTNLRIPAVPVAWGPSGCSVWVVW